MRALPPHDPAQRRDWFANNAPPMPEWFKARVVYPTYSGPPRLSELYPDNEVRMKAMSAFAKNQPMPVGAERYAEDRLLFTEGTKLHKMLCDEAEFAQWRAYYARLMVDNL